MFLLYIDENFYKKNKLNDKEVYVKGYLFLKVNKNKFKMFR